LALEPTGEPLWDFYAHGLVKELPLHRADKPAPRNRGILQELLAAHAEFGARADYWELLCFEAMRQGLGDDYLADVIEAARDNQAVSAELLWLNYQVTTRRLLGAIEVPIEKLSGGYEMGNSAPAQRGPAPVPEWIVQSNTAAAVRGTLLDELVERFPAYSVPYYERALLLANAGDYAAAMRDFAAGNASPLNVNLHPYPVGFAHTQLREWRPLANAAVEGLVLEAAEAHYPRLSGYWLDDIREQSLALQVRAGMHGRSEELILFHQFLTRLGRMEQRHALDSVVAANYAARSLRFLLVEQADSFTAPQRAELAKAIDLWLRIPVETAHSYASLPLESEFAQEQMTALHLPDELARVRAAQHGGTAGAEPASIADRRARELEAALHFEYVTVLAALQADFHEVVVDPIVQQCAELDWNALLSETGH
jgi:plasmid stability protein